MQTWLLSRKRLSMRRTARSVRHRLLFRALMMWKSVSMASPWPPTPPRPTISVTPTTLCSAVTGTISMRSIRRSSSSWSSTMTHKDQVCLPTVPSMISTAIHNRPPVWLRPLTTSTLRLKPVEQTARSMPIRTDVRCPYLYQLPLHWQRQRQQ